MKKTLQTTISLIFIVLLSLTNNVFAQTKGDIYLHMLTTGQPQATFNLGDKFTSNYFIQFEVGQESWNATEIGIGQSNSNETLLTWLSASWFADGSGTNKQVQGDLNGHQFTATGTWYFAGRAKGDSSDPWHYANDDQWGNSGTFSPAYYFTVNALPTPSTQSATAVSMSQINLKWTRDATYDNVIVVVRKGSAPDDLSQGTTYNQGDGDITTSAGYILYKGNADYSSSALNHTSLLSNTTYYYSFFTVNNNYYSPVVSTNATTHQLYTTAADTDWNITSTWTCGCIPPEGAETQINHAITINSTVANNPDEIEITAGSSITFEASGDITANTSITNEGTIDMTSGGILRIADGASLANNSTFTAGTGEVFFAGTGTVSGTITFYNASLSGAVNFGGNSSIDNILQLYGGGYLDVNSIIYNLGSTLKYAANYTLNSGDKSWYSNVISLGTNQEGVPCNVEIPLGITLTLNDNTASSINGNILIDGTFELSSNTGGDFKLKGDFTNNGTFTPNDREITFNGTSSQNLTGATTFDFFKIDGLGGIILKDNITVNKTLTFTNGKITLGANNITVDNVAGSISGGNSSSYAITNGTGYLIQDVGITEKTFPVGTATSYAPAFLTQAGTQEDLYVRVKSGVDNATNDDDFTVNLQWTIDEETAGSNNITTKFQWSSTDENTFFDNQGQVKIGRYITGSYSSAVATISGSEPYIASASGMTDDISAEISFIVGNTMAFSANSYRTAQNGNWDVAATWVGGAVPPANAICMILHHVTVNTTLNNADEINIYENKSVTFQSSGILTINGILTNHGMLKTENATASITINGELKNTSTASINMIGNGILNFTNNSIFTNDGSFTAGTGTVDFAGDGTATGTLVFNNLNISGNVDLGISASLNNILTLSGGGNLINNSIIYSTGSTLRFDQNYSLGDNQIWYRDVNASGNSEIGIPWNVEIPATRVVDINDEFYRAINGNLIIDGQFDLSSSAGGDFKLKGDFTNNGTFNHNSRSVEFYGNGNQKIKGSTISTFSYAKINNIANITIETNCNIANNLDFTNGNIILGGNNLTVLGSINSADATKYVITNGTGYLIQNVGTTEKTFPIGTLTGYNPAYLIKATTAENLNVRVQNSIDNIVNNPTEIVNIQWTIDEATPNGDNITTKFQWNATDQASNFTAGTDKIAYFLGTYNNATATTSGLTASRVIDGSTVAVANMPFIVADTEAFNNVYETDTDGDWTTATNWLGDVVPPDAAEVVIKNNINLTSDEIANAISIASGATLNCGSYTITLNDGGAISNSGTFTVGTGKVIFSGTGAISSGAITFNNVDLNGAVSFGSSTIINGILSLNTGGSINTNAPVYGASSTLKYNQGGAIARASEWQYNIAENDPGYPANVQISNSTILDVDADDNDDNYYQTRFLSGNLIIDALSEITLSNMGGGTDESNICGVYAKGDIINNGIINLSSNFGGDMMIEGDIINTGTINWNSRAIFFTGDNNVNQNITGLTEIPFILITRGANVVLQNNITVNGSGDQFITFARPSSTNTGSIDLNGNTLTCSGDGNIELNNISGAEVISSAIGGRIEVTGGNATYSGTGSGTLNFGTTSNTDVTLAINGGTMTFPETLGIVTVYGTLEIGDGVTISNIPTYGNNSTLHYKKGGSYTMGVEWGTGSDVADNIPKNVTVSEGVSAAVLNMNANRHALGKLLIENNATLTVSEATGQLTINNLTVDAGGTIILKSPTDNSVAGSLITTGTVTNNGTMQAERYVSGFKYTYISPPNSNTNSQLFTNNSNGHFNPNFYTYNQAFAAPTAPASGTYEEWEIEANEFKNAWIEAHDGEGGSGITLDAGKGYAYYNDINKMFVFDGTFNSGTYTTTLTYDSNDGNDDYFDGWNLIANPYPSALNWDDESWVKTNIVDASIYYWDGTNSNEGNYKYYVSSVYDDGTNVINGGSQMIPASQAFFVKANSLVGTGGKELEIPNNARVHSTQSYWNKNSSKNQQSQFIRLQATANNASDELVVRYITEGTTNYDGQFDAYKMYSYSVNTPQIYSYNENSGAGFAINSLPISELQNSVPIGMEIKKGGESNCTISLTKSNIENKHIYFEDLQQNTTQNMIINPTFKYVIDDNSDVRERFYISYEENMPPVVCSCMENYYSNFGEPVNITLDAGIFSDNNTGDTLIFNVYMADKMPLPEWLHFDSQTLTLSGMPDKAQELILQYTATDIFGKSATTQFNLTIIAILPEVTTVEIVDVFTQSANIKGELISNGGIDIETIGLCWSITETPTLQNNYSVEILANNQFEGTVNNLQENTIYYVRSYATNSAGTEYGNQLNFITLATNINPIQENTFFEIHPNPTTGKLIINNKELIIDNVEVTNITGKIIQSFTIKNSQLKIDLSNYSNGVYFIKINTTEGVFVEKIIKH